MTLKIDNRVHNQIDRIIDIGLSRSILGKAIYITGMIFGKLLLKLIILGKLIGKVKGFGQETLLIIFSLGYYLFILIYIFLLF